MSKLNLLECDKACHGCVKGYKNKHDLKPGGLFQISCNGIPKEYLSPEMKESLSEDDTLSMLSMIDPVTWARETLDWHCEDPDGEVWKRKTIENSLGEVTPYIEEKYGELVKQGKSAYHRPYQRDILRCSAARKVLRLGRQLGKSEVMCIAILHALYTHKGFKVLIITPYQSQVELLFGRLSALIKSSKLTQNSVKRYVKAPNHTIELHNGSVVRGFTSGAKSGGNADSVRGQRAQLLVFDEADYLNSADMGSALSVITNYPDAMVWMSSTPTGKREKFYDNCHSPLWKEYHYPAWNNPLWSDDLESFYRGEFTDIQYNHEVGAEFGEQEQGVYQTSYVDDAMVDYNYSENSPEHDKWIYTIGVDWNDFKVGTTIAVVGFNPTSRLFKLMTRVVYQRDGWTQLGAIERLVELNRHWKPKWIYIDYGYGNTQYEIIKKFGYDAFSDPTKGAGHPDAKLSRIVKQYNFGSKIIIKDLFTKQDVEKESKPFLIENSVRRFEQRMFHFSKHDKQLESEYRGYIIDHVTTTGAPVYKQGNEKVGDHNLDAVNLALVAITLEESDFGKVAYDNSVGFVGPLNTELLPTKPGSPTDPSILQMNSQKMSPSGSKPTMDRNTFTDKSVLPSNQAPGANLSKDSTLSKKNGLWAWPGWERDAPAPSRSTGPVIGRRVPPPTRKKI